MRRLLLIAMGTLILAGVTEDAAAATWRLAQPSGETVMLTVTNTAIHIVTADKRIEIPVTQVHSLRITTHYLDLFEMWEPWPAASGATGVASLVDPEAFIHITWRDGDAIRAASIRTGFFTPFVERRLRDAGIR